MLGSAEAAVDASFDDGVFRFTSALDRRQLEFTSDEGTFLSSERIPLRREPNGCCGAGGAV